MGGGSSPVPSPLLLFIWTRKEDFMNFKFIIAFFVGLVVYLIGLFIFAIIKRHRIKKKVDYELRKEELKDENTETIDKSKE